MSLLQLYERMRIHTHKVKGAVTHYFVKITQQFAAWSRLVYG